MIRGQLLPGLYTSFPDVSGKLFLSFDDGPDPEVTPAVIHILEKYNAKATFFCLGKNVEFFPEIFQSIVQSGHTIGNHGYNHYNGWTTPFRQYIDNIEKAGSLIPTQLFRPPYGKIGLRQYLWLRKKYTIVLWDVMSYDFKASMLPEECSKRTIQNSRNGSVVVFHDNKKASKNVLEALPIVLNYFSKRNFTFEGIPHV
jgi:peptidoglycan-N-acetylglucosamine deacetylase